MAITDPSGLKDTPGSERSDVTAWKLHSEWFVRKGGRYQ